MNELNERVHRVLTAASRLHAARLAVSAATDANTARHRQAYADGVEMAFRHVGMMGDIDAVIDAAFRAVDTGDDPTARDTYWLEVAEAASRNKGDE